MTDKGIEWFIIKNTLLLRCKGTWISILLYFEGFTVSIYQKYAVFYVFKGSFLLAAFFIDVLAGYNGTIFAYGQTASGKTHTMEVWRAFYFWSKPFSLWFCDWSIKILNIATNAQCKMEMGRSEFAFRMNVFMDINFFHITSWQNETTFAEVFSFFSTLRLVTLPKRMR